MAIVSVKIGGKDYQLACDDGQEEQLHTLAYEVDDRVRDISMRMGGSPGENMGLLLASVMMADELIDSKKEISRLSGEVRQLLAMVDGQAGESRNHDMEEAMAIALDEIAARIENIAGRLEVS